MGRKAFEPTDQQRHTVRTMAVAGIQRAIIAKCVINPETDKPIGEKTLAKAFAQELEIGTARADSQVVAALFRTATGPPSGAQVAAAIFWCKTKLGWRETTKLEFTDPDDEENTLTIEFVRPDGKDSDS